MLKDKRGTMTTLQIDMGFSSKLPGNHFNSPLTERHSLEDKTLNKLVKLRHS